jgi:hypothetical protein
LRKGAVRATYPRLAIGRARTSVRLRRAQSSRTVEPLPVSRVSSRPTMAQQVAAPYQVTSPRSVNCCAFRGHSDHPRLNRVDSFSSTSTTTSARTIYQQAKLFSGKSSQENKILIDSNTKDAKFGMDLGL